jgi:hypothetical protein
MFLAMANALTQHALTPLEPTPEPANAVASPQTGPAQLEPSRKIRSSRPDVVRERYRKWGFRNGPEDLELTERPEWLCTFEEALPEFGYKTVGRLKQLAKSFKFPKEALSKELIPKEGIQLLKEKRAARRNDTKELSKKNSKKRLNNKQVEEPR